MTDPWSAPGPQSGDLPLPLHEFTIWFTEPADSSGIPEDENSLKPQKSRDSATVTRVNGAAPGFLTAGKQLHQAIGLTEAPVPRCHLNSRLEIGNSLSFRT